MIKLVVFDFDGTLTDNQKIIFNIIKKSVIKAGYKLPKNYLYEMGNMPLLAHLHKIGIKKDAASIADEIKNNFIQESKKVKPVKNIRSLREIKKNKIILTNNDERYVRAILKRFKVDFFNEIHGGGKAKDKVGHLKLLLKKKKVNVKEAVYVGDKNYDAYVARKVGCISVVVSTKASWSPRKDIIESKPDFIIDDLSKLKNIINKLDKLAPRF